MAVVDIRQKLALFSEHWSPKVVARLNDHQIKQVFVWHTHDDTDELFLVIEGSRSDGRVPGWSPGQPLRHSTRGAR